MRPGSQRRGVGGCDGRLIGAATLCLLPLPRVLSGALQGLGRVDLSQIPEHVIRPLLMLGLVGAIWAAAAPGPIAVSTMLVIFAAALAFDGLMSAVLLLRVHPVRLRGVLRQQRNAPRRALTLSAVSFGAIASAHVVNANLDVVMLGLMRPQADAGIYKAASVLSELVAFGLGAINAVILPQIASLHAKGDRAALQALVSRSAMWITAFALVSALGLVLAGSFILPLIFGAGYSGGYAALVILALGQFANAAFGPVALVLNMTGNENLTLIGLTLSILANAVLNAVLIPRFGIEGAAIATATTLLVWNLLLVVALKRRTGIGSTILSARNR